jgi:hypothetical protein
LLLYAPVASSRTIGVDAAAACLCALGEQVEITVCFQQYTLHLQSKFLPGTDEKNPKFLQAFL